MATRRTAYPLVNYQQRAKEFAVGDMVFPFGAGDGLAGRVVAVYPGIGMVDVQYPTGVERAGVEDLMHIEVEDGAAFPSPPEPENAEVPGGVETVVTESPESSADAATTKAAAAQSTRRVAEAFVKKALYWGAKDRHYKATKLECESGVYLCPKCKDAPALRKAVYQRSEGKSKKLLGCPNCLFLIDTCDIIGHPDYLDDAQVAKEPFHKLKIQASSLETGTLAAIPGKWVLSSKFARGKIRYFVEAKGGRYREVPPGEAARLYDLSTKKYVARADAFEEWV